MRTLIYPTLAAAFLLGCSPYVYQKEVALFDTGVQNLKAAGDEAGIALVETAQEYDFAKWSSRGARTYIEKGCFDVEVDQPCRIEPASLTKAEGEDYSSRLAERKRSLKLLKEAEAGTKALSRYVAALKAVSNAEDSAELKAEIDKLAGSLQKLGDAAALGAPIGQAVKLVGAAYVGALDAQRLEALKLATAEAHDAVAEIVGTFGVAVKQAYGQTGNEQRDFLDLQLASSQPGGEKGVRRLYDLTDIAKDTLLLTSLAEKDVSASAVKAHKELRDALASGKGQASAAFDAILDFAKQADELRKALDK